MTGIENGSFENCDIVQLGLKYHEAINEFEEAADALQNKTGNEREADGVSFSIAAENVSQHSLDRAEHFLEAMSFATCSSKQGALLLMTSAARELDRAIQKMVPRYNMKGDLETSMTNPSERRRRAHRMQAEALRYLKCSEQEDAMAELVTSIGELPSMGLLLHTRAGIEAIRSAALGAATKRNDQAA